MNAYWIPDDTDFSVTYPTEEIVRRANLKVKIHDRNIPMTSDVWGGGMSALIGRFRRFSDWKTKGVEQIKVFYNPGYYIRNRQTVEIMDPLHLKYVLKYAGIKA